MSPEEIAMCLHLQEPRYFTIEKLRHYASEEYVKEHGVDYALQMIGSRKGTGRTAWMLCEALSVVSCEKRVFIEANSAYYAASLHKLAKQWAKQLGLNADLIMPMEHQAEVTFQDHTVTLSSRLKYKK